MKCLLTKGIDSGIYYLEVTEASLQEEQQLDWYLDHKPSDFEIDIEIIKLTKQKKKKESRSSSFSF